MILNVNVDGMDPRGTTGTEITAIDHRNVTRITTDKRRYSEHWDDDHGEEGRSKRNGKVRITLSFLMFSATYNLQRVMIYTRTSLMESRQGTID